MGANGIETDVQMTKDGVLVLFHDKTMERIFGINKQIRDFSWMELQEFDAGIFKGNEFVGEKIVSLQRFLETFGRRGLKLAIEIKQEGIEDKVLKMVRRYVPDKDFTITSFMFDSIKKLSQVDHVPELGYLTEDYSEELIRNLKEIGVIEYCPSAEIVSTEMMKAVENQGLRVRAWGVKNTELMEKMVEYNVYGMTVNFPDKLTERLKK